MSLLRNRTAWVWIGFGLIGAYFLWAEHSAHLALAVPYLPYLLLLVCPLLHVFMHGGHGHGHGGNRGAGQHGEREPDPTEAPESTRAHKTGGRDG